MGALKPQVQNPGDRERLYSEALEVISFLPLAADADAFLLGTGNHPSAAVALTSTSTFDADDMVTDTCPCWPVVPVVQAIDAAESSAWTSVTATIVGIDQFGDQISEAKAATNSSGTWTATLNNAFQRLITITVVIVLPDGSIDTTNDDIKCGFAKTYGLGRRCVVTSATTSDDVVVTMFDGAADAGTLAMAYQTYAVAGTPDAAKVLSLTLRPSVYYRNR